jgi:hypothetical protein
MESHGHHGAFSFNQYLIADEKPMVFHTGPRRMFGLDDLFTQPGTGKDALVQTDILGPSETFRGAMDYFAHSPDTNAMLERLANEEPATLACMHGSGWRGDCAGLLRDLANTVSSRQSRVA